MKKLYKVTFEEKISGEWLQDRFSNGGRGYSYNEALEIKEGIERDGLDGLPFRDLKIEELEPGIRYRIKTETGSEWGAFSSKKEAEDIAERFSRKYGPSHYDIIERTLQEIAGE